MQLHNKPLAPIYLDQFREWRNDLVTQHLFRDLERTFLDCTSDPLSHDSIEQIAIEALRRDSWRELIDIILEWNPSGVSIEEIEDNGQ